jgi:hypothetical protein
MENAMINILFAIGIVFLILAFLLGICLNYSILRLLKKNHPSIWNELGRPSMVLNNSIRNNFNMSKFIKTKEYLKTNDNKLIKIAEALRIFNKVYFYISVQNDF